MGLEWHEGGQMMANDLFLAEWSLQADVYDFFSYNKRAK